jgi:1-hydroxycarotenoid 3,4-desaturase
MSMNEFDAVVVGGGVGGLCSAILLGGAGLRVLLLEKAESLGGKAGAVTIDGVEVDTGPSVLTLPDVFDDIFVAAGLRREEQFQLTRPSPGFRYVYRDGVVLDVFSAREDTVASVHNTLGAKAAREFSDYLSYAERIWNAAAPHFVYNQAPDLAGLLFGGPARWRAVTQIDPLRTLGRAIDESVGSPHLQMLLKRYATYNGSDVRSAPATLGCIAHVELSLGGYGVRGGMFELVKALERAARRVGVDFEFRASVEVIEQSPAGVSGIRLKDGRLIHANNVVANADVTHLANDLLKGASGLRKPTTLSMSAHTGILRAVRPSQSRPAHTVLFPVDYEAEFRDIFDRKVVPEDPTIYLCAQEACHGRKGWSADEPLFCMVNAPAMDDFSSQEPALSVRSRVLHQLRSYDLVSESDAFAWWRTPAELAARFPGSQGSLYGAASNTMQAAFQRPPNRIPTLSGLYLASGSAHPGGGLPMVALSAKQAVAALLRDRKAAA